MDSNENGLVSIQPTAHVMDDVRRAREFYRYLQPDNLIQPHLRRRASTFDVNNEHVPSLSAALAPYCQLVVLRCNATKAMLNVMDRDVMYFLAESSRKSIQDGREDIFDFVEDPIFLSCSSVPLKGRICELTIRMNKDENSDKVPSYVIPDLTKSQFSQMSIVTGPPYYRFYAGVPMMTRDGINIGSIAVMDTKVRPEGLTETEERFLANTTHQIMLYLETNRQAIEGRRSRRMAEGLEAFIAGKKALNDEDEEKEGSAKKKQKPKPAYGLDPDSDVESDTSNIAPNFRPKSYRKDLRHGSIVSLASEISASEASIEIDEAKEQNNDTDSRSHNKTFRRAANLLRECMGDLGEDGSVWFVTVGSKFATDLRRPDPGATTLNSISISSKNHPDSKLDASHTTEAKARHSSAFVIACSTDADPFGDKNDSISLPVELDDIALSDLMKRYPSGHLWSLEESRYSSSDDDNSFSSQGRRATSANGIGLKSARKRSEVKIIRATFPGARQVLFAPLWDATSGSFAHAVFVATALETRSFNTVSELSFLNSFCSTLMGECSRLDTMMADKQKSDFVGTISHEMRSPLHGVLASVEFLGDTAMNGFQKSLVDTIDSCGRTLLDTINHVLDFSKVNSFQKQWQAANRRSGNQVRRTHFLGPDNSSKSITAGAPPLLQLFGVTDISAVLEEVVDGLVLGQTYNSGIDLTDVSSAARGRDGKKNKRKLVPNPVEVFVDIEQADWAFMTQPGAVRRIIMNLTGNAIKYTSHGTIVVTLRLNDSSDNDSESEVMVLTVADTGKGISPDFLASKLFVPFAQENALAPGTGLGLSIVKSIVLMLGGNIDVRSVVNKGTTVEISLPLKRPLPGQMSTQNTPHSDETSGSGSSNTDDSLMLLQHQAAGATVVYYQRKQSADDLCCQIVQQYVRDWHHLDLLDPVMVQSATIVIVQEEDLEHLIERVVGTPGRRPAIVVICSVVYRHSASMIQSLEQRISSAVEFLAKPCGPHKLARSLRLVLEKKKSINPRFPHVTNLGTITEVEIPTPIPPTVSSTTPVGPSGEELAHMDLNSAGCDDASKLVQATETFAASQSSHNAQMAIQGPITAIKSPRSQANDGDAYPFPAQQDQISNHIRDREPNLSVDSTSMDEPSPAVLGSAQITPTQTQPSLRINKVNPNILIVDDNKINLKLLETFLKVKRKYTRIVQAEDGQQAVDAVTGASKHFDIIFMDISMPIKNGFMATREIRQFEARTNVATGAMVIALTGLASGKDQSEGFDSGCDLYMTKPVSFKEVGKLLDNWEKHQTISLNLEMAKLSMTAKPIETRLPNGVPV